MDQPAVNTPSASPTLPPPAFHTETAALRFWVPMADGLVVGASISKSVLHYRFQGHADGSDAVKVYEANQHEIDTAVVRRVGAGSREPVMLREYDLPAAPRR